MFMLRDLRKQKGLTMKELGEMVGVAESTISQYETEKREPDFETLLKFGEIFDVPVDYILRGDVFNGPHPQKAPAQSGGDIETMIDTILSDMTGGSSDTLMLSGSAASPEAIFYLRESIRANLDHAIRMNEDRKKGE